MRVIHVPRRFAQAEWGGTETTILNLCRAFNESGDHANIYTSKALNPSPQEYIAGVAVKRFKHIYPFFGLTPDDRLQMDKKGGNLLSLSLFFNLLKNPDIDIFHAHTGKRTGGVVRTVAKLLKRPYVVTLHGGYFDVPPQEAHAMLAPNRRAGLEWGKVFGALFGARRVLEDANAIICVGEKETQLAQQALPHKLVVNMRNGVDAKFFASGDGDAFRQRYAIAANKKIVLCVSRIDYQKNQLGLVESLPQVLQQEPNAHLVLIGPVTVPEYAERLKQKIANLGLNQHVTHVNGLGFDDPMLANAYHAADVFCLASQHEPFGIVILEAWAAGIPVATADVGGIPSFTHDGIDCLRFDPNDSRAISTSIMRLLSDSELAKYLSANGRKQVAEKFSWQAIGRELKNLYQQVIAEQQACKKVANRT